MLVGGMQIVKTTSGVPAEWQKEFLAFHHKISL